MSRDASQSGVTNTGSAGQPALPSRKSGGSKVIRVQRSSEGRASTAHRPFPCRSSESDSLRPCEPCAWPAGPARHSAFWQGVPVPHGPRLTRQRGLRSTSLGRKTSGFENDWRDSGIDAEDCYNSAHASVAQLDRAPVFGTGGWRFESSRV